ncbi:MAG: hypothetical protein ACK5WS_06390 [Alphaproteobacteria bacterium]|jgi:protocatechuate 3,4-dioxygenase alpha subunit|nr:hypothetical protein [Candidatus Jidaibacter sp.]
MRLFFILLLSVLPLSLHAKDLIKECELTPAIWHLSTPNEIATTNNLRRKTGSSEFAHGTWITITGKVTDSTCTPVSDAIVEIWQANSFGGLDYSEPHSTKARKDHNFLGTGSTTTNNEGVYNFFTVFPGATGNNDKPKINIRIRHRDFLPLETSFYFEQSVNNTTNTKKNKTLHDKKSDLLVAKHENCITTIQEDDIKYNFNITLEGKNLYRKY